MTTVPPLLLPEALGFSPQLLIDDIIDCVNDNVTEGVRGMESFLLKWAERRSEENRDWDSSEELEPGLVAFQTLLEHHTDIALDFFEAWALKNIFAIPPGLPVVLPHQQGLDLTIKSEREQELIDEISELRKKLDNQKQLKRLYTRALRTSKHQRSRSERRLEHLSVIDPDKLNILSSIPTQLTTMHGELSKLPPLDPTLAAALPLAEPGKPEWETSKAGYLNWATAELLTRARSGESVQGSSVVDEMIRNVAETGEAGQLRRAVEVTQAVLARLQDVDVTMELEKGS